ncbi:MAG TPA: hypothetical protein VMY34_04035 [Acidimicrobiales bacterium]|nr:hypothetical protein [Acidimicrobiales bacterium]
MPNESAYIQVAADGSGKKVANVAVTEPQAVDTSGNAQADLTRYQQEVTIVDRRGDHASPTAFEAEALNLLRDIAESLAAIRIALT